MEKTLINYIVREVKGQRDILKLVKTSRYGMNRQPSTYIDLSFLSRHNTPVELNPPKAASKTYSKIHFFIDFV